MYTKSIAEIIKEVCDTPTRKGKVDLLKKHGSLTLKNVLILTYDKSKKFLIPSTRPPFTPSKIDVDNYGALYREARKLKYLVEGFSPPGMSQLKREMIFIEMLESVCPEDAEVLLNMIQKTPYKGLTIANINDAFGQVITK